MDNRRSFFPDGPLRGLSPMGIMLHRGTPSNDRREFAMAQVTAFDELMVRLRDGNEFAAAEVFNRFVYRLIALARSQFDTWIRHRADPEDVVQSVYRSFFTRCAHGQFRLADWDSLWGLLAVITLRKCVNRVEYMRAARRDVLREVHPWADGPLAIAEAVARDPGPSEAAALTETIEVLMRRLPPRDSQILSLHLQGYEIPEIAEQVGRSQRTVRRALDRAHNELSRLQRDEGETAAASP